MKQRLILLLSFILITAGAFAQKDFRKGYIVNNEGDTIYGYLDYRGNKSSAIKCLYKPDLKQDAIVYKPSDIQSYRFINGKYYVSKSLNDSISGEKLFLEYIINGIADIYYYRDINGEHYFIDKGDGKLIPLKSETQTIKQGNTTYTRDSKEYVGTLKYLMADAPSISNEIDNSTLSHKSLIKVAQDYHGVVCTSGECIVYEKKIGRSKKYFGALVGAGYYTIFSGDNIQGPTYMKNMHFTGPISPSIGLFFKTGLPTVSEKMFFQCSLGYSQQHLSSSSSFDYPTYYTVYNYNQNVDRQVINSSILFKFERQQGTLRPFWEIGAFLDFYISEDYSNILSIKSEAGEVYQTMEYSDSPFSGGDKGLQIGGGFNFISLNRLMFVELKYQYGFGQYRGASSHNFLLNLGIPFGKCQ